MSKQLIWFAGIVLLLTDQGAQTNGQFGFIQFLEL